MSRLSPARLVALRTSADARKRDAYVSELLDGRFAQSNLAPEDRAFARVLCLGVATTWGTLDELIDGCLRNPTDVKDDVRDALRISTYEMYFLDKAPHAAVDQGVELVRSIAPKAAGLANAVLRKLADARESFPFGDPATDRAALARLYGFPAWLADKLVEVAGMQGAASFMEACNQPAPLFFGVNAARAQDESVVSAFAQEGILLEPVRFGGAALPGCYHAPSTAVASSAAMRFFESGSILVSDAAAQAIAALSLPKDMPERFLEVGAGRGTKTVLLQSHAVRSWGSQMRLTSLDSFGFKVDLLEGRARQYGIELERAFAADARDLASELKGARFGAALVDAPCSGLGTLRRHPEIRWKMSPAKVASLAATQLAMLEEVARYLEVGGQLTYSTCTFLPEENEYLVKRFLETQVGQGYRIVPTPTPGVSDLCFKTLLAPGTSDAHFACRLMRTA